MPDLSKQLNVSKIFFGVGARYESILIFIWAFVLSCSSVSYLNAYLVWVLSAVLLAPIFVQVALRKRICYDNFFLAGIIFVLSIWPNIYFAKYQIYTAIFFVKLFLVFIVYLLLRNKEECFFVIFSALIFSVFVNALCIFANLFFNIGFLAHPTFLGDRWLTIFNDPGYLSKLGLSVFVYSFYLFLDKISIFRFLLLVSSIVLVIYDGSRTDLLAMILGSIFVFYLQIRRKKKEVSRIIMIILLVLVGSFVYKASTDYKSFTSKMTMRGGEVFLIVKAIFSRDVQSVAKYDDARFSMIKNAFNVISEHPLVGAGMRSTGLLAFSAQKKQVVAMDDHITYLEIWEDFGLLAFFAYIYLIISWIFKAKPFTNGLQNEPTIVKAIGYNTVFMLSYFILRSLFHSLSDQISEWMYIMVFAGFFWSLCSIYRYKGISSVDH